MLDRDKIMKAAYARSAQKYPYGRQGPVTYTDPMNRDRQMAFEAGVSWLLDLLVEQEGDQ